MNSKNSAGSDETLYALDDKIILSVKEPYFQEQIRNIDKAQSSAEYARALGTTTNIQFDLEINAGTFDEIDKLAGQCVDQLQAGRKPLLLQGFFRVALKLLTEQAEQRYKSPDHIWTSMLQFLTKCAGEVRSINATCKQIVDNHSECGQQLLKAYENLVVFLGHVVETLCHIPLDSLEDPRWATIWQRQDSSVVALRDIQKDLSQILSASTPTSHPVLSVRPAPQPRLVHVLPRKPPHFFGRRKLLKDLSNKLQSSRSLTLEGIGGVGKTYTALYFAHEAQEQGQAVFWIQAEDDLALSQSFTKYAVRMKLPDASEQHPVDNREALKEWLLQYTSPWLLVFDNVEDASDLDDYWPEGKFGHILVTARSPNVAASGLTGDCLYVKPFEPEEGRDCLNENASLGGFIATDVQSAAQLNEELGGLPLAVIQMSALIKVLKVTIADFLVRYRDNRKRYHKRRDIQKDAGVGAIWSMSFTTLKDSSDAKLLLGMLCFLSAGSIPQSIFNHWELGGQQQRSTSGLLPFCQNMYDFEDVEARLLSLALVGKDPATAELSIHRLVQVEFEYYMEPDERQKAFDVVTKLLHDVFPRQYTGQRLLDQLSDCARYIQHVIRLCNHFLKKDPNIPKYSVCLKFAQLMASSAWYLFELADYPNIGLVIKGGLIACEQLTGTERDETYAFLNHIEGTVDTSIGHFGKAKRALLQALEVRKRLPDPNQDHIAATLNNLGLLYESMNLFDDAEVTYSEARAIQLNRAPSEDRNLSLKMVEHNLQRNALQRGATCPTQTEFEETVAFFKATRSWWMTGHAEYLLGNYHLKQMKLKDSAKHFQRARCLLEPPDRAAKQPAMAMCIFKQGYVAYLQSDFDKSITFLKDSSKISDLHPAIRAEPARTQLILAKALERTGDQAEAASARSSAIRQLTELCAEIGRPVSGDLEDEATYDGFITAKYR